MVKEFFDFAMQNGEAFVTAVIIMVSTVIVLMGIMKGLLFNKIQNKAVRCVALSFVSIALMFGATAILFAVNAIDWKYFVMFGAVNCIVMIVTYWFYENTQARAGIHKIGSFVLSMIASKIVAKVNGVAKSTEAIGSAIDDMLKKSAKSDKDKDLKNL